MDVKDAEKPVVAKPVASRPSISCYKSFTELLAGAINAAPIACITAETTTPIRPKTVRFKPPAVAAVGLLSPKDCLSDRPFSKSSSECLRQNCGSNIVYKPSPRLISKPPDSTSADLGKVAISHHRAEEGGLNGMQLSEFPSDYVSRDQFSDFYSTFSSHNHGNQGTDLVEHMGCNPRPYFSTSGSERPCYDGYNWRKYGQKQVKGSEYPRSYYKCTHPNCPVKKKVERSLDGQIAEIVYKGEHNHLKPQPPKKFPSVAQGETFMFRMAEKDMGAAIEANAFSDGKLDDQVEFAFPGSTHSEEMIFQDKLWCTGDRTPDNSCLNSANYVEQSKEPGEVDDEPACKQRKIEDKLVQNGDTTKGICQVGISTQNSIESEILEDGFRWRKYGQKVVKGSPYPRSYYRCTSLKCNMRKYVERASDDPSAFITTYEGKHNHEKPVSKSINSTSSATQQLSSSKFTS